MKQCLQCCITLLRAQKQLRRSLAGLMDNDLAPNSNPATAPGAGAKPAGLSTAALQQMLDRMIKMTAENKITKDNAWDLSFIDHMADLVK